MRIAMLGSGFIARNYCATIQGQRRRDRVVSVYSRQLSRAQQFAAEHAVEFATASMEQAVQRPDVDAVCISLPNHQHEEAVLLACRNEKAVLCTKPLGRNAAEALRMLEAVERCGVAHGYLEDLVYTPKFLKAREIVRSGAIGRILWTRSREAHRGPHSPWFRDAALAGGGCILDLGCHCVEIGRCHIGKDIRPAEVMCWADAAQPGGVEDNAVGMVRYENGALAQFEVSWTFLGGLDLRDEIMGSAGSIWTNGFLRTGFEVFTCGKNAAHTAEKAGTDSGWTFPVGDESNELGLDHMFTDMLDALEHRRAPGETFYDGYVVNAILDAAYSSQRTRKWEPVELALWRGAAT